MQLMGVCFYFLVQGWDMGGGGMGCSHGHCRCTLLANAVPPLVVPEVGVCLDVHLQHSSARMGVLAVAQDEARGGCNVMNSKGPSALLFEDHCRR